jgi:hypothetical protein
VEQLNKLTTGDKVLSGGALAVLIGMFLPWFKVDVPSVNISGVTVGGGSSSVNGFHYAFQIFENALGLRRDISFHDLLCLWIERDLSGEKYKSISADGLRIGTDGFRSSIGCNGFNHTILPFDLYGDIGGAFVAPAFQAGILSSSTASRDTQRMPA